MTAIHLSDADREQLGRAVYRGLFDLNAHPPADVDRDWATLRVPAGALIRQDYEAAGIEVVNSLRALPAEVRAHIARELTR